MKGEGYITFPFGNKILITGNWMNAIVSLNTETKEVESTDLELQGEDDFSYFNNGMRLNDSIYLVGDYHLHIFDLFSNKIRIIKWKGFNTL